MDHTHAPLALHERRERVFILLAGLFLGCMTMLNILGITRFIHIGPLALAVGVLPYPLTFLCTDFIGEFYGRRRANYVVWVGFALNLLVIGFLWLGNQLPAMAFKTDIQRLTVVAHEPIIDPQTGEAFKHPDTGLPLQQWVVISEDADGNPVSTPIRDPAMWPVISEETGMPVLNPLTQQPVTTLIDESSGEPIIREEELYTRIYMSTRAAVFASMLAYLAAQFCDVFMFHFWKKLTRGRHLWLRNNGSTMISQLVDACAVIFVTFGAAWLAGKLELSDLLRLVRDNYLYKLAAAALDTIPFYLGVRWLTHYLQIDPTLEHDADREIGEPA